MKRKRNPSMFKEEQKSSDVDIKFLHVVLMISKGNKRYIRKIQWI